MEQNAIQGLQQDASTPPPVDLKKYYQDNGIIPKDEAPKVQMPEAANLAASGDGSTNPNPPSGGGGDSTVIPDSGFKGAPKGQTPNMGGDVQSAAEGVGKGLTDIVKNVYNAGIDAANGISKVAASMGVGRGDVISDENKIQFSQFSPKPGDPTVENVFRGLTRYGAPVAAVVASGGSALAGMAAGAGVDFATLDPHQERLANLVDKQYPDLKNVAVLGNVVDYLANHENESDLEGRFKNALEGTIVGGTMHGAMEGAVVAFRGAQKVSAAAAKYLAEKSPALARAGEEAAPLMTAAAPMGEEQLAAVEKSYSQNSLLIDSPTITAKDGSTLPNPNHGDTVLNLAQMVEQNRDALNAVKYRPKNGEQMAKEVQDIISNPERSKAMLRDTTQQPLSDAETQAIQVHINNFTKGVMELADKAAETGAPEDLAAYTNSRTNWNSIQGIKDASGSTNAARLNSQNVMKEFMAGKTIGQVEGERALETKKVLIDAVNKFSGGEQTIADEAQKVAAIYRLTPEQADSALQKMRSAQKGGWAQAKDTGTFVMINAMLSSAKTFTKVATSQVTTTLGSAADQIMAAALPKFLGGSADHTMKDAMNFLGGGWDAIMENMASVGRSIDKRLPGGPMGMADALPDGVRKYNVDFTKSNPIKAENYGLNPESLYGKVVDIAGQIVGGPSKLVGLHDSIFGQIPYRGTLNQLAEQAADKAGQTLGPSGRSALQGADREAFINNFMYDPPIEAHEQATKAAQEATMMGPYPDNYLGQIGRGFSKFAGESVPQGNMLFPFMKIGFNIADYTYQHSPFKALAAVLSPSISASMGAVGSPERAMAIAKIANGSLMLGGMTYLASQGLITGHEPSNYNVGKALEESNKGWMPDSIHTPNGYVSLKGIEPLNSYMRLGALMAHAHNYTTADEYQQLVAVAGGLVAESFSPEMLVQNTGALTDAIKGLYSPQGPGHPVANLAADLASRFVPNVVKDVRNVVDVDKGDTTPQPTTAFFTAGVEKLKSVLANRVPWLSENLPIERNKFGEPLLVPAAMPKADVSDWRDRAMSMVSPFAQSSGETSPLVHGMQILGKYYEENQPLNSDLKALNVQMPSKTFRLNGVNVPLTPQEYERYVMYSAGKDPKTGQAYTDAQGTPQDLRTRLESHIPALVEGMKNNSIDEKTYNFVVGKLSGELVRAQKQGDNLMMQDPEFRSRYNDALNHAMTTKVGTNVFGN